MKIYLWKRLAQSQARFAERPPWFLLAATSQGHTPCWSQASGGSWGWGTPVSRGESRRPPPSQPPTCGRAPSAAFLAAPRARTRSRVICRWGEHPWKHALLQQRRVQTGPSEVGALASSRPNPAGCLREQALLASGCHQPPFANPFSGGPCQQAGRAGAARGGRGEAKPQCHTLWATCPCARGIGWAQLPTRPNELGHQA